MTVHNVTVTVHHQDPHPDGTPRIALEPDGLQFLPAPLRALILELFASAMDVGTAVVS